MAGLASSIAPFFINQILEQTCVMQESFSCVSKDNLNLKQSISRFTRSLWAVARSTIAWLRENLTSDHQVINNQREDSIVDKFKFDTSWNKDVNPTSYTIVWIMVPLDHVIVVSKIIGLPTLLLLSALQMLSLVHYGWM